MSNEEMHRKPSRILMLRPHPWAYHPVLEDARVAPAGVRSGAPAVRRQDPGKQTARAHVRPWLRRIAVRLAVLEERIQRLATRPPWFP